MTQPAIYPVENEPTEETTSAGKHVCQNCGSLEELDTPQISTESFCSECYGFQKFVRGDCDE